MRYLAKTADKGVRVVANATNLNGALDSSSINVPVYDYTPFSAGDDIIVGEEEMTIGTAAATLGVVRASNSTIATAHENGAPVLARIGTSILTHTFTGSEVFSAIRVSAHEECLFAIEKDGTILYKTITTPYRIEVVIPFIRYTPEANEVWKVRVWAWSESVCYAIFQS